MTRRAVQDYNTRHLSLPAQTPSSRGNGVDSALRFDDLHRRLRLLGCVKNRAPMLHLLQVLAGTGTADKQRGPCMGQMPPRVFSEPWRDCQESIASGRPTLSAPCLLDTHPLVGCRMGALAKKSGILGL